MPDETDWLMKPVLRKMCLYESVKNGVLDLVDFARMNDAIEVNDENERRLIEAKD